MITGGCSCGQVRYQANSEPLFQLLCHCRDCQKASGTGHVPVMGVAKALFKVVGYTKSHAVIGGSGKPAIRNFCANCGSLVFGTPESAPHLVTIYAGSLDDPATFQPQIAVNTKSRSSWDRTVGQIPEFDTMPPRPPAN